MTADVPVSKEDCKCAEYISLQSKMRTLKFHERIPALNHSR